MTRMMTLEQFTKRYTNGIGKPEWMYKRDYGNIPFEEGYKIYVEKMTITVTRWERIEELEVWLRSNGIDHNQSNISESRYYSYNGWEFRFSGHIHPSGSMTTENKFDFAADAHLIDRIEIKNNELIIK